MRGRMTTATAGTVAGIVLLLVGKAGGTTMALPPAALGGLPDSLTPSSGLDSGQGGPPPGDTAPAPTTAAGGTPATQSAAPPAPGTKPAAAKSTAPKSAPKAPATGKAPTQPAAKPPAASSTKAAPPPPARTSPAAPALRTVTGATVQTPYGPVQVAAVMRGSTLVDVKVLQTPTSHSRSRQIAAYAVPILTKEALAAQSAQIHAVSGATYTSEGFAQSLQSALSKA